VSSWPPSRPAGRCGCYGERCRRRCARAPSGRCSRVGRERGRLAETRSPRSPPRACGLAAPAAGAAVRATRRWPRPRRCRGAPDGPGEAAEARAIARRLLRERRGRAVRGDGCRPGAPETYAPLFEDLFSRLGIPHRLHPSLPLRFGRAARSLLLLFRCRGLARAAVMEFLTFAPVPFAALVATSPAALSRWDQTSRDGRHRVGSQPLDRRAAGLRGGRARGRYEGRRTGARERRLQHASEADPCCTWSRSGRDARRAVREPPGPSGRAAAHGVRAVDRPERDREALLELIADLGGLGYGGVARAWEEVEQVVEARLECGALAARASSRARRPRGSLDAMAGCPSGSVAIPGLVEVAIPASFVRIRFCWIRAHGPRRAATGGHASFRAARGAASAAAYGSSSCSRRSRRRAPTGQWLALPIWPPWAGRACRRARTACSSASVVSSARSRRRANG